MSEWKETLLSEIATYTTGKLNSNAEVENGTYPFFTCSPITLRIDNYAFDTEALILAGNNANGVFSLKYYNGKFNAYQRTYVISIKDLKSTDYKFLYYALKTQLSNLEVISHGTATKYLTLPLLNQIPISLPSCPEQRAIASVLSSLDDKIDLLHRQNKTLEAMAETLFRQWFVEEADEGWETARVGDFVRTNVASINKDNALKTIRYLDTGSLTEGKIEGYQTFDIADAPSRARRIVKHNNVLISTVRPNQKHYGILKNPAEDVIVSTGFCVITCDKINPHFIYILLTTDEMTEYLHSIAEGSTSTYPSLKPSDIEGLEFQLPPQEKLDAFSEYAYNIWRKIEYNHTQIITIEKLRDTLLPKLMSGEVRVEMEASS